MNAITPIDPATPEGRAALRHRQDGWLPDKQRAFLEGIARGLTVEQACRLVGLSPSSAYAFRNRAAGAAFALGWRAANLVARECVADALLSRAIDGQVETYTRADGSTVSRHRYDNRLAAAMLARLDRQAEDAAAPAHHAARLVAQDFEAFCDQIERDDAPARAGLFLGLRAASDEQDPDLVAMVQLARADRFRRTGAALAAEVDVADLDPARRSAWTAEQWVRAEAAGLVALAPANDDAPPSPLSPLPADEDRDGEDAEVMEDSDFPVWEDTPGRWRTRFPPPHDFDGDEQGEPGDADYQRDLTPDEQRKVEQAAAVARAERVGHAISVRDSWFRAVEAGHVDPEAPLDEDRLTELEPPMDTSHLPGWWAAEYAPSAPGPTGAAADRSTMCQAPREAAVDVRGQVRRL